MKRTLLLTMFTVLALTLSAQKYVGGDISMLPEYEKYGAKYYSKSGTDISNNVLGFMVEQGWNAARVRLFVDPSKASETHQREGVRQDLEFVKALGKRIKDAGMAFMLDFHYSDTWADPSNQWTPDTWKDLDDDALATKVYEYTKESLQALVNANAAPDFIQTGNEISYGMLWGTQAAVGNNQTNRCYTNSSDANWNRFFTLLKQAGKACREVCPDAKIILHSERTPKPNVLTDFFDRMKNASVDYDIIGLSYYPAHHGNIATLENAINVLENKKYGKSIMIVEVGYSYAWPLKDTKFDYTETYPYTEEGQRQFTADLITMLNKHESVTGLFWWWPEDNGNASVTDSWWNAALYNHDTGKPYAAFYELQAFTGAVIDDSDVTNQYIVNPSFDSNISGWTNTGGTAQWKQNTWGALSNYCEFGWTGNPLANQEVVQTPTLPAGSYKLSVNCASNNGAKGIFLIAGDQSTEMVGTGEVGSFSVEFSVTAESPVKLGLKLQNTTATWVNFDNFYLEKTSTTGISPVNTTIDTDTKNWYSLDGRQLTGKPTQKGLYIHGGKKIIIQ